MKTLILVRHAKSSWSEAGLPDRERPLNKRGRRDAPAMGRRLARRGVKPDRVISSAALRARLTAEAMAGELGCPAGSVVAAEQLYCADVREWFAAIDALDDGWDTVMLVGHNPTLTDLAAHFLPFPVDNVPTCGVMTLTYRTGSWRGIAGQKPHACDFDYPKKPPC